MTATGATATEGGKVAIVDPSGEPVLRVEDVRLSIETRAGLLSILRGVTLDLARGEALGIVGESGSGKSMTANAILGLLPNGARIDQGSVTFDGIDMTTADERTKRGLRGDRIGTILQDPNASLNPTMRIGAQVSEPLQVHRGLSSSQAATQAVALVDRVGIQKPDRRVRDYPHQFSGGMRQRIVGAAAISCSPTLIIADEPTTALDVTVQAAYLNLLKSLQSDLGAAMVFISHDLSVVSRVCDRVSVMYAGGIVESAPTGVLFAEARHPYTMGLISCLPSITEVGQRLTPIPGNPPHPSDEQVGCAFAPRCPAALDRCHVESPALRHMGDGHEVACHRAEEMLDAEQLWPLLPAQGSVRDRVGGASDGGEAVPTLVLSRVVKTFTTKRGLMGKASSTFTAVGGVDLKVFRGESVAVVGESGSGKTTCIRMALGLELPTEGEVLFNGRDLASLDRRGWKEFRRRVQAVFQDPYTSFNPRMTIERAVSEPLMELRDDLSARERRARVEEVLAQVGLDPSRVRSLYPHQVSGGQRQRVAIARALATEPDCLVLDEPVSALDVSIRVQVLNLLKKVQEETGVGILSISHDLGAVKYMSDRVLVMRAGEVVEEGAAAQIYHDPQHAYTRQLLADALVGHEGLVTMIRDGSVA